MTVFYSRQDRFCDRIGGSRAQFAPSGLRATMRRIARRIGAALRVMHQAIVTAKTRRLQRERLFHGGAPDGWLLRPGVPENDDPDADGARIPQRPLVLGDKWDF